VLYETELENCAVTLEKAFPQFDFDQEDGKITIHTQKGILLINWHGVAKEIWLSSPITGAHHFLFDQEEWRNTRTGFIFKEQFTQELNILQ
jgi:CyaY protein